jgi:hypothetical protein
MLDSVRSLQPRPSLEMIFFWCFSDTSSANSNDGVCHQPRFLSKETRTLVRSCVSPTLKRLRAKAAQQEVFQYHQV